MKYLYAIHFSVSFGLIYIYNFTITEISPDFVRIHENLIYGAAVFG